MMSELTYEFFSMGAWADRLITASWQGGLFLAIAWMVSRFGRGIPATVRCWIWRIAYLKFAFVLLFGGLLQIPLLPSSTRVETALASSVEPGSMANRVESPLGVGLISGLGRESASAQAAVEDTSVIMPGSLSVLKLAFFGIWIMGCAIGFVLVILEYYRMGQLIRTSEPIKDPYLIRSYRMLCGRFKISRPPRIASTTGVHSPVLTGLFRQTILIPASVLKESDRDELRLVLAHELAHCSRRDLVWNWLPVMVRTCFFFHPLVWLTQSRFSLDQEIVCDQLALNKANIQPGSYGNMLVKVSSIVSFRRVPSLTALGVASSYATLKLRIFEMYRFNQRVPMMTKLASGMALGVALLFVLPVGLTAQQEKPQDSLPKKQVAVEDGGGKVGSVKESTQQAERGNVSVTVNQDGKEESLKIEWNKNGRADVTYSTAVDGKKIAKTHNVKDLAELASKNKDAFKFYKAHVNPTAGGSVARTVGSTSEESRPRSKRSARARSTGTRAPRIRETGVNPKGSQQSSSDSSSSSAWQTSSMTNNNGVISRSQDSGTTGNGMVGGNGNGQMIQQIQQMIDQSDNPQMKDQLQQMLDQFRGK